MTWVRVADDFYHHPKITAVEPLARWLWLCGLSYVSHSRTDGFLPERAIARLTEVERPYTLAQTLVDVGLWARVEGGYQILEVTPPVGSWRRGGRVRSQLRRAWEAIAHRVRPLILERDGYTCQRCGATSGPMQVDHIVPLSWGGSNDPSNLQCFCTFCNISKGDRWSG